MDDKFNARPDKYFITLLDYAVSSLVDIYFEFEKVKLGPNSEMNGNKRGHHFFYRGTSGWLGVPDVGLGAPDVGWRGLCQVSF